MRIPPTSTINLAERHVQFSEYVDVRIFTPTDTQTTTIVEPSMHAEKLQRMMRTVEIPPAPTPQASENPARCVRVYKRVCDTAYLACGVAAFPALGLAALGPIWLLVPAGLFVAAATCYVLRGKPTLEMEQEYEARRVFAQAHDSQGA